MSARDMVVVDEPHAPRAPRDLRDLRAPIEAVLFDLDGVLVHSEAAWFTSSVGGSNCSGVPAWASAQAYPPSTQVTSGGKLYAAKWHIGWSHPSCPPSSPASWCPAEWTEIGPCN
ncbi:hypothetical protein WMF37_05215 [Sorangium sp. So ce291]|uniref:hypothetical protein n=1 Tax=Sorangium sp. So ce291 TaxID=3133294 RepID=UPI003F5FBD59